MKLTGTSMLSADRAAVWRALNDPAVLVQALPGCQRLEAVGPDAYTMTVSAGVGAVKGVYDGEVRLSDHDEPASFLMTAQGAGAPGTIGATVRVTLAEAAGGGTALTYDADAVVGGMIGGVGQRMLSGVSKKMADEFFRNVDALLLRSAGFPPGSGAPKPSGLASLGLPPDPSTVAPEPGVQPATGPPGVGAPVPGGKPATAQAGQVFTAPPAAPRPGPGFVEGVGAGAAAALVGALVGAWIRGRR